MICGRCNEREATVEHRKKLSDGEAIRHYCEDCFSIARFEDR